MGLLPHRRALVRRRLPFPGMPPHLFCRRQRMFEDEDARCRPDARVKQRGFPKWLFWVFFGLHCGAWLMLLVLKL
jgi:hypothetical protein